MDALRHKTVGGWEFRFRTETLSRVATGATLGITAGSLGGPAERS